MKSLLKRLPLNCPKFLQRQRKWGRGRPQGLGCRPIYFYLFNKHLGSVCSTHFNSWNPPNNLTNKKQKTPNEADTLEGGLHQPSPLLQLVVHVPSFAQKISTQHLLYAVSCTTWFREQKDEQDTFPRSHYRKVFENKWDRKLWREGGPGCYFGQWRLLGGGDISVLQAKEKMEDEFGEGGKLLRIFWTLKSN